MLVLERRLADERIVAVGLLTQREVEMLGHGFSRLWPLDDSPCFSELLQAIDRAERELRSEVQEPIGSAYPAAADPQ
jgi:hypothetical protein